MRFILMGSSAVTTECLKYIAQGQDEVAALIIDEKEGESGEELAAVATGLGIPWFESQALKEKSFYESFSGEWRPDATFAIAYQKKIPPEVIKLPKIGAFNWHPSLLPKYRGGDPYFWAILEGERITGLTVHFIAEDYDSGDIIYQEKIELSDDDTWGMLASKIDSRVLPSLVKVMELLRTYGASIPRQPQDHRNATYAPRPKDEDFCINWKDDAQRIARLIRASNPDCGARASFKAKSIFIFKGIARGEEALSQASAYKNAEPGAILEVFENSIIVKAGKGLLEILILQVDWDYLLTGADFARIESARPGDRFISIGEAQEQNGDQ